MAFFDEDGEYWGNVTTPVIGIRDKRLETRSVKIFADGAYYPTGLP